MKAHLQVDLDKQGLDNLVAYTKTQSFQRLAKLLKEKDYKARFLFYSGNIYGFKITNASRAEESVFETSCKITIDNYRDFIAYFLGGEKMVEECRNLSILE